MDSAKGTQYLLVDSARTLVDSSTELFVWNLFHFGTYCGSLSSVKTESQRLSATCPSRMQVWAACNPVLGGKGICLKFSIRSDRRVSSDRISQAPFNPRGDLARDQVRLSHGNTKKRAQ